MLLDYDNNMQFDAVQIQKITDRHFGLGGDGLIRIGSRNGHFFMDYYNTDGSTAQMCGNGVRATASLIEYLGLHDFTVSSELLIETRSGVKLVAKTRDSNYRVDMGKWSVVSDLQTIDLQTAVPKVTVQLLPVIAQPLPAYFVDMGNEHLVVPMCSEHFDALNQQVPILDQPTFKVFQSMPVANRLNEVGANFEFITISKDTATIQMRVVERGVGETLSCGTGICASAVVAYLLSGLDAESPSVNQWTVCVRGGELQVEVEPEHVFLTGSAQVVGQFEFIS